MAFVDFNNLVDDDGTGLVGTLMDVQEIKGLLMGAGSTLRTDTGTVNNWNPGMAGHTYVEWNGTATLTVTGIVSAGFVGQSVVVRNIGTGVIYFQPANANSAASNRFWHSSNRFPLPVAPGGWIMYRWGPQGIWMLVGHQQGAWVPIPYAASNYTASGSMTWTVEAGDVLSHKYRIDGLTLWLNFYLATTTIGGTPSTDLNVLLPAGCVMNQYLVTPIWTLNPGARVAVAVGNPNNTVWKLQNIDGSAWTANTNGTYVAANLPIELQV